MITRNAFRCRKCGTVVESKRRYDCHTCPCGNGASGGLYFIRRWGKLEDMEELSESTPSTTLHLDLKP